MKKRASMLTAMVIILIAVFACVGFKMMTDKNNGEETNVTTTENSNLNEMSSETAKSTILKSLGNVNFVEDYTIITKELNELDNLEGVMGNYDENVVAGIIIQDNTSDIWNVWRVNRYVNDDVMIGFLFDDDKEVVWATPCNRDFIDQETLQLQLDFTNDNFHDNINYKDGDFAWAYKNCASCASDKEATSVWAYDKTNNTCSLVWYNNLPYND